MTPHRQVNPEAASRMQRAGAQLVMQQPFFASLYLRLVVTESDQVETMGTDGVSLPYNPDFVLGLTMPQLIGVLAHEASHLAALHPFRRQHRDFRTWNEACDYAINPIVVGAGLELPPGALIDPRFDGMAAEEIYRQLERERDAARKEGEPDSSGQPGAGDGPPAPAGGCGAVFDPPAPQGGMQAELDLQEAEWRAAIAQALQLAKAAGKIPAHLAEEIRRQSAPLLDWREQLHRWFTATDRTDYSWMRPNRRFVASGLYLPSLRSEEMGEMVLAVDTSGSVTPAELEAFAGELAAILDLIRPRVIHVVYCDAMVQAVDRFERDEFDVAFKAVGRGGTRFLPVFDWIEEQGLDPACLVYLTDLECDEFPAAPGFPTLWVSTNWTEAPFGDVVKLQL
jgi:predicted metal-dependent peptidase